MTRDFIAELASIKEHTKDIDKLYNIFTVLHNRHDERRLHSRFIASLLNPNGSHEQGDKFLRIFLDIIKVKDFELKNINVYPKEDEKKEWKNIDIYIKSENQAIVIENKIFAGDSNKIMEDEQEKAQLLNYYEKVKDEIQVVKNISLVYLTLNGKNPSLAHQFNNINIKLTLIDYIQDIPNWLNKCLTDLPDSFLRYNILQYLNLIKSITNDFELTMKLRALLIENIDEAFKLLNPNSDLHLKQNNDISSFLNDEFHHIKWHTVHEFWNDLANCLINELNVNNIKIPKDDLITTITHKKIKRNLILDFEYHGKLIYIANDSKGFSWGMIFASENHKDSEALNNCDFNIEENKAWKDFGNLEKIVFSDFKNRNTFELIKPDSRKRTIEKIVSTIAQTLQYIKHEKL